MIITSEALCLRIQGDKLYIGGSVSVTATQYASIVILDRSSFKYQDHIAIQATGYKFTRITEKEDSGYRVAAACASSSTDTLISVHNMSNSDTFTLNYFAV